MIIEATLVNVKTFNDNGLALNALKNVLSVWLKYYSALNQPCQDPKKKNWARAPAVVTLSHKETHTQAHQKPVKSEIEQPQPRQTCNQALCLGKRMVTTKSSS